jgi:phosphatidylserine decarboxylase
LSVATFAAAQILRLLPRRQLSRVMGRLCERPLTPSLSRFVERAYVRAFDVDMSEVLPCEGGTYASFDAFFTRPLREGARHIDPVPLVSPADGLLVDAGPVQSGRLIVVKGKPYSVPDLVGSSEEGDTYANGSFAVVYLSPRDYHRVHAPVDGIIRTVRSIPGDLYPVNAIGERHVPRLFARNQRVALFLDTEALGRVAVVLVGALIVGRVSVTVLGEERIPPGDHPLVPPQPVQRGTEIGKFHLGSTVVLLTSRKVAFSHPPGVVRYGEGLVVSGS